MPPVLGPLPQVPPNHDDPSVDVTEEQRKIDEADALTEEDQAEKEALLTKVRDVNAPSVTWLSITCVQVSSISDSC